MKYINLIQLISILLLSLIFTSCDDGMLITDPNIKIVNCDEMNNDNYTPILTGDTVEHEVSGTTVTIRDNEDGTRDICVNSGAAHILR